MARVLVRHTSGAEKYIDDSRLGGLSHRWAAVDPSDERQPAEALRDRAVAALVELGYAPAVAADAAQSLADSPSTPKRSAKKAAEPRPAVEPDDSQEG